MATAVVLLIVFITVDLDRPHRSLITVPDRPLVETRASMDKLPAASGTRRQPGRAIAAQPAHTEQAWA